MAEFDYAAAGIEVREDIAEANRRSWDRLAAAGTWWSGAERIAIASAARSAEACGLCLARREALSPESAPGDHDASEALPAVAIDAAHRIATDAGRLSRGWYERTRGAGLPDGHYVELVGVVANQVALDTFHRILGLPPATLPAPDAGEPSRYRPVRACDQGAYVPLLPWDANQGPEADLWESGGANVLRALSLVPEAVRELRALASTY